MPPQRAKGRCVRKTARWKQKRRIAGQLVKRRGGGGGGYFKKRSELHRLHISSPPWLTKKKQQDSFPLHFLSLPSSCLSSLCSLPPLLRVKLIDKLDPFTKSIFVSIVRKSTSEKNNTRLFHSAKQKTKTKTKRKNMQMFLRRQFS